VVSEKAWVSLSSFIRRGVKIDERVEMRNLKEYMPDIGDDQ